VKRPLLFYTIEGVFVHMSYSCSVNFVWSWAYAARVLTNSSCIGHALCDTVSLPSEEEVLCGGACGSLTIPIDRFVLNAVPHEGAKGH
jgi:hypothetical protein